MSRSSIGYFRLIGPTTRGTGVLSPEGETMMAGLSASMPSSAVAKRFE